MTKSVIPLASRRAVLIMPTWGCFFCLIHRLANTEVNAMLAAHTFRRGGAA